MPRTLRPAFPFLLFCLLAVCPLAAGNASAAVWVTVHVDDDAPGDPGPDDPNISDPMEDGSAAHPFDTINEALGAAGDYLEIVVHPGAYVEAIGGLPPHCRIAGSGRSSTIIDSAAGIHAFTDGWGLPEPPEIALSDFTLNGPGIDLTVGSADWNLVALVSLTRLSLGGGDILLRGESGYIDFSTDALGLSSGEIYFSATGCLLDAGFSSLEAPAGMMQFTELGGGVTRASVSGGTVGGIMGDGFYGAYLTVDATRFTGPGIRFWASESGHAVTVSDATFEDGGIFVAMHPDIDGTDRTDVVVSGSRFHGDGIQLYTELGGAVPGTWVESNVTVDACLFDGGGINASIRHHEEAGWAGHATLRLTNNVFLGAPGGIGIDHDLGDATPSYAGASISTTILNNTFFGSTTGVRVTTAPHVPGRDPVVATISNNIIVGGVTGVMIDGTDDLQLVVTGNDLFDHAQADYAGDINDPTGLDGNIAADPLLRDPAGGDVTLLAGSPCIDAAVPAGAPPAADFFGTTRPQDGDGDGVAVPDIGAAEYLDVDADGYSVGSDCNDANASIHPGAIDIPGNLADENCDGIVSCDPNAAWAGHGRFMACVARTCEELVTTGALTTAECDEIVRVAARSDATRR